MTKSRSVGLPEAAAPSIRYAPTTRRNAWEDVADLVAGFGLTLDSWQEDILKAGLAERVDGRWAARQIGVSVPRQNGKGAVIVARVLAGLLLFDERLIIVSAHRQDTARETFFRLVDLIDTNPDLAKRVDVVIRSEMREYIRMKSGAVVRFKSRATGAGRGLTSDLLIFDEAQAGLDVAAFASVLPTMSARPNPQLWMLGTPPTADDDGEVFGRLRAAGVEGKAPGIAWVEYAADKADDPADPQTWAKANPAFGIRIDAEAIEAEHAALPIEQFREERLGIWTAELERERVVPVEVWDALATDPPTGPPAAVSVDMSPDRQISVAGCWLLGDGRAYVCEIWAGDELAAAQAWVEEKTDRRTPIVIDRASPAAALVPGFTEARKTVLSSTAANMAQACTLFLDSVLTGALSHGGQPQLDDALAGARKRSIRDAGGWGWDRRDTAVCIAPLVAVTLAAYGAATRPKRRSSGERRAVVL